jgi:hypothetical protein
MLRSLCLSCSWRFLNGNWQKGSTCEDNADLRHVFVHFASVAPGSQWMQEPVSFAKLKLSNRENGTSKVRKNLPGKWMIEEFIFPVFIIILRCFEKLHGDVFSCLDQAQLAAQVPAIHSRDQDKTTAAGDHHIHVSRDTIHCCYCLPE